MFLSTVGLRGFGHDRRSGVTTLHVARTRTNHSRGCATLQTQPGSQRRQSRNQHGDDDFDDLFTFHDLGFNGLTIIWIKGEQFF